ncbi:ABC transporter substrate-binding protein [Stratiformator vulcanicus]|uniref:Bacterial extracellular solute-binding protein, family 5 Middle n=1 Tax=Stratiformator vulcanicus TaxID=2527980 RepID=A0A517R1P5_9PLAN|nr:ABC transporter substrate-binding protein [Stratiformator vulcanicus]QDT37774.1 Bacterial extracellular solute-binding protein, family 5 Middle [Stratiformator vulcanicus]
MRVQTSLSALANSCVDRLFRDRFKQSLQLGFFSLALLTLSICFPSYARSQEDADSEAQQSELPKFDELELPPTEKLLSNERRDWIVLKSGRVLVAEPVYPRPNTLEELKVAADKVRANPRLRVTDAGREEIRNNSNIAVILPGSGEVAEYLLPVARVEQVLHHEDLMLRRAQALLAEPTRESIREAFELLFVLGRRTPDWPGLTALEEQVLIAEARVMLEDGRPSEALIRAEDLYARNPNAMGLEKLADEIATKILDSAIAANEYRRARYYLARLSSTWEVLPAVRRISANLIQKSEGYRDAAIAADDAGDHAKAAAQIELAALSWPRLDEVAEMHRRLTTRFQRLRVAVPRLSAGSNRRFVLDNADIRVHRLTQVPVFEVIRLEGQPIFRSKLLDNWLPTDLGRKAVFKFRSTTAAWSAHEPMTAGEAWQAVAKLVAPSARAEDTRFAAAVSLVRTQGKRELELGFTRIPLSTEALMSPRRGTRSGGQLSKSAFREFERSRQSARYGRVRIEPDNARTFHVAEVTEAAFPSFADAAQAFDRDEVDAISNVPPWALARYQDDESCTVSKSDVPDVHFLQFNPRSPRLKSPELRRALIYALDRPRMGREILGRGRDSNSIRTAVAPYSRSSIAADIRIEPRPYDRLLALSLSLSVKSSRPDDKVRLVLVRPDVAPIVEIVEQVAEAWNFLGVDLEIVDDTTLLEIDSAEWDIVYRCLPIVDPVSELSSLLSLDPQVRLKSLMPLSDRLRQALLRLERASDPDSALQVAKEVHQLMYHEVPLIPLFETDHYWIYSRRLRNRPERSVDFYQDLDRWELRPTYPQIF